MRFFVGGAIIALFSAIGEVLKPKSFAGLFGAAPSVAIVSLALAYHAHGSGYVAREAPAMAVGAVALASYALLTVHFLRRRSMPPWLEAGLLWFGWAAIAFVGWALALRKLG